MARYLHSLEPRTLNPELETLTMINKIVRAHLNNAKAARKHGNRRLARTFLRFARAAQTRA